MPVNLLLAALDSLCVVQRMPEEYTMTVSLPSGYPTFIVWAHHLLGLSVLVRGKEPSQDIWLANNEDKSPQVIIDGCGLVEGMIPEICLLNRKKEIQLRVEPADAGFASMEARERLLLYEYASRNITRGFNEPPSFAQTAEFHDAVEFTIAMAIVLARRATRTIDVKDRSSLIPCSIPSWQLFEAAAVLFPDVEFSENLILKYADEVPLDLAVNNIPRDGFPSALRNYAAKKEIRKFCSTYMAQSAVDVMVLATVADIDCCRKLPLIAAKDYSESSVFAKKALYATGPISVAASDFFNHVCWLLLGPDSSNHGRAPDHGSSDVFMASDYGWTICLPSFGDYDPARVKSDALYVREGVPTDKKTLERKSRVRDASAVTGLVSLGQGIGDLSKPAGPRQWVVETGIPEYTPRCLSPVKERIEYYGTASNGFHLTIKFRGSHRETIRDKTPSFECQSAYRQFHDNLWKTFPAPACQHCLNDSPGVAVAKLNVDAATVAGHWAWYSGERGSRKGNGAIAERLIIVLVKGDARARWLAVGVASDAASTRRTMLRGPDSCEECAVDAAAKLPGKWFVII